MKIDQIRLLSDCSTSVPSVAAYEGNTGLANREGTSQTGKRIHHAPRLASTALDSEEAVNGKRDNMHRHKVHEAIASLHGRIAMEVVCIDQEKSPLMR